jgi:nicotinate-nucleotide--dimethylbenzimidazole phosphoribosyltransferase
MGIGNTTTSTAVGCALLSLEPEKVTGRGAGLDNAGLARKKAVISQAIRKYDLYRKDALTVLRTVGGLDIAGLAGIFIGGALYHVPIVLDGMITAVAALAAERMVPGVRDYMIASHLSKEPITRKVMEELNLHPVICADLALGEGTGAAMLFPLLDMALTVYRENDSFSQMQIDAYERY